MKTTLAQALHPGWSADLPLLALILSRLLTSAAGHRELGRWGSWGPTETLIGHAGCTGCEGKPWHSSRSGVDTAKAHAEQIRRDITAALFDSAPACREWRKVHCITPDSVFRFSSPDPYMAGVDDAMRAFQALHGHRLPASINSCHRDVKVLCFPQLYIGGNSIWLGCEATSWGELRRWCEGASRWDVAWLIEQPAPRWRWQRETFGEFLLRGVEFFKAAKLTPKTN